MIKLDEYFNLNGLVKNHQLEKKVWKQQVKQAKTAKTADRCPAFFFPETMGESTSGGSWVEFSRITKFVQSDL